VFHINIYKITSLFIPNACSHHLAECYKVLVQQLISRDRIVGKFHIAIS